MQTVAKVAFWLLVVLASTTALANVLDYSARGSLTPFNTSASKRLEDLDGNDVRSDDQRFWCLMECGQAKEAAGAADITEPTKGLAVNLYGGDLQKAKILLEQRIAAGKRSASDYNNLGLVYCLAASTSSDAAARSKGFEQSEDCYTKANALLPPGPSSQRLAICQNEVLLAESRRDNQRGAALRKQAQQLRDQLGVTVPVVQW